MPVIVRKIIHFVKKFLSSFFQVQLCEIGVVNTSPTDSSKTIFVSTQADIERVWFSVQSGFHPYNDITDSSYQCYVSEAMAVPGGFEFQVIINAPCVITWFAIENH